MTRVVVLTAYYRPVMGGVESNAERLAQFLVRRGCPVRVLTKRVDPGLPDRETIDGVDVERIGPVGARSPGGKWRLVPAAASWLARHASSYDVVCCIDYRGVGLGALLARVKTGRPILGQAQTTGVLSGANIDATLKRRGIRANGLLGRLLKWPSYAVYHHVDAFACISHEIEREVLACGIDRERVHYLPNAIDMTKFRPPSEPERQELRRGLNLDPNAIAFLFVGRLSREKGLMDLMDAWRLARPSRAVLLVVGPDMESHAWNVGPAARAFVTKHRLEPSVRFLGPMTDVRPVLTAADVLVQPSHFEALGLSAIEALACGVPVVASATGGLLEFIVDDRNGLLFPPHDSNALADCLRLVTEDDDRRRRLAAQARASVESEYDEDIVFGRFAAALDALAGAPA